MITNKRIAFISAIFSLIPLGQPLIIKTGVVLSTTGLIFFHAEKTLANSFNVDYDNAIELFAKSDEGMFGRKSLGDLELIPPAAAVAGTSDSVAPPKGK